MHHTGKVRMSYNLLLSHGKLLLRSGMGDNKNFMSRYIIRVIIMIIDIITISLNSATGTKIVNTSRKYFIDMNVSEQCIFR